MNTDNYTKENRIFYLDFLRVIACLSVIMLHSSAIYVTSSEVGSFAFWIGHIFDSMSRIGVPVFVMISGALMLDEKYNFNYKKLSSHICKIIIFYIFWSATYCFLDNVIIPIIHNTINFNDIIIAFISGPYHLWFCIMIIGLYFLVPLLRLWVKKTNKKQIEYFLFLSFLFIFLLPQIIKICNYYSVKITLLNQINSNIYLNYVGGYVPYFILGWYLHNFDFKFKKTIYSLGILGLCFTIIMSFVFSYTTNNLNLEYGNISINILFQTSALFVFIKSICEKHSANASCNFYKSVMFISKNSLGIYAIHAEIVSVCYTLLNKFSLNYVIINIIIIFVISFVISLLASFIIRKIPLLKKVV